MNKFSKFIFFAGVLCAVCHFSAKSRAQTFSDLTNDLLTAINADECSEAFSILWPYVKERNPDALEALLFYLQFEPFINLPGRGGDYISRVRDIIIIAANNYGLISDNDIKRLSLSYIKGLKGTRRFFECVADENNENCHHLLHESKIIPRFDVFIREVDALINAEYEASCVKKQLPIKPEMFDETMIEKDFFAYTEDKLEKFLKNLCETAQNVTDFDKALPPTKGVIKSFKSTSAGNTYISYKFPANPEFETASRFNLKVKIDESNEISSCEYEIKSPN